MKMGNSKRKKVKKPIDTSVKDPLPWYIDHLTVESIRTSFKYRLLKSLANTLDKIGIKLMQLATRIHDSLETKLNKISQ